METKAPPTTTLPPRSTARTVSFIVLLGVVLLFAFMSYEVLSAFVLPMFLAVLLVLLFKPLHLRLQHWCRGRDRIAAGITTVSVLVIVMFPLIWIAYLATSETIQLFSTVNPRDVALRVTEVGERVNEHLPQGLKLPLGEGKIKAFTEQTSAEAWRELQALAGPLYQGATQILSLLLQAVIILSVMMLCLYYFLADGPALLATFTSLLPLQESHKRELLIKFASIARAVIVSMLASAVAQGFLAGIGYYFAGLSNIFLLTALTMVFALVPFVGSTVVWLPCVLWLLVHDESPATAIALGIYCAVVVSAADNLIKPFILQGQSNLHPLLALLSIMGGASTLGPIGILVGPMVLALLQTGLLIVRHELAVLDRPEGDTSVGTLSVMLRGPRREKGV